MISLTRPMRFRISNAGHLHQPSRRVPDARRPRPCKRPAALTHPSAQALAGSPGLPQVPAPPLPQRAAIHRARQLLAPPPPRGPRLVRDQQRRARVHLHLRQLAELDRSRFTALRSFTLNNSDYTSHQQQATAIRRYVRWRNQRATPKRDFAINSPIRQLHQSDYLNKVA